MKKYILVILMIFSFISLSGCKKTEEDKREELSTEQFYQKLVELKNKVDCVDEYTIVNNFSIASPGSALSGYRTETTKDLKHNRYASITKDVDGKSLGSEWVLKNDDNYIKYTYQPRGISGVYQRYYVGNDYIKYSGSNDDFFANLDLSSYDTFLESFNSLVEDVSEETSGVDFRDFNQFISLYKEEGVYNLVINYNLSGVKIDGFGASDYTINSKMSFDDEFMIGFDVTHKVTFLSGTYKGYYLITKASIGYQKVFKENMMITDFSQYTNPIEPAKFEISYYLDGQWTGNDEYTYDPNGVLELNYGYTPSNSTFDGWYIDENCTIKVDHLSEYPSYDLDLYAKTKPNPGYGLVKIRIYVKYDMITDITNGKKVMEKDSIYVIPSLVDGDSAIVENVKLNGKIYKKSTIEIKDGEIYYLELFAKPVEQE